jgi:hypothetical protein
MKQSKKRWLKVLLVLLLIAVMADVTVRLLLMAEEKVPSRCLAIPTRFILKHPECAQRLVEASNVTNVRILSKGSLSDLIDNRSRGWLKEARKRYNMT